MPPPKLHHGAARPTVSSTEPEPALWYKDAIIYELYVRGFSDANGDGNGDLRGLIGSSTTFQAGRRLPLAAAVLPLTAEGRRLRHRRLPRRPSHFGTAGRLRSSSRAAHARGIRIITDLVINHTSDQHPWFQAARRRPGPRTAITTSGATPTDRYGDARIIFRDTETSNWTWDPGAQRLLLAPLLQPSARPQFRQSRGRARRCSHRSSSGSTWAWMACGSTPSPTCSNARGRTARTCPRPTASSRDAAIVDRAYRGPDAPGRGQPVARGPRRLLRRWRRVPHGLPLPADAADVHGRSGGRIAFPIIDIMCRCPRSRAAASGRSSCATTTS